MQITAEYMMQYASAASAEFLRYSAENGPIWSWNIGTMRFSDLSKALNVSTKSLTDTLRHLEKNGIISRTVIPTVPVTVQYALTEKGRGFDQVLLAMKAWENEYDH